MEKYINVLYIEYNDGKATTKAIYDAVDRNACIAKHHSELGKWMVATNVKHVLSIAIETNGGFVIAMENVQKEQAEKAEGES